jgi:hypothetical protein
MLRQPADMESSHLSRLRFVGGPYDGCDRATSLHSTLCGAIEMPVSRNVLRLLTGEDVGPQAPIHCVASYRLVLTPDGPRYWFSSYRRVIDRAESRSLEVWLQTMLSAWQRIRESSRRR